ncbi:hypothetical protein DFH08DRAFT_821356 [Mycena albidolilacea]|uniref:Uncharacterized protein n=1 Tax=Mycena albidolilacea TaxID=1033008 RepID=A0AAD7EE59_9AGAR|nr:hypothetical protein DFH08DRAFT_821356 [Mycena albidolilacea]
MTTVDIGAGRDADPVNYIRYSPEDVGAKKLSLLVAIVSSSIVTSALQRAHRHQQALQWISAVIDSTLINISDYSLPPDPVSPPSLLPRRGTGTREEILNCSLRQSCPMIRMVNKASPGRRGSHYYVGEGGDNFSPVHFTWATGKIVAVTQQIDRTRDLTRTDSNLPSIDSTGATGEGLHIHSHIPSVVEALLNGSTSKATEITIIQLYEVTTGAQDK